jgi:hypothetical protein
MSFLKQHWQVHFLGALSILVVSLNFRLDDSAEVYRLASLAWLPLGTLALFPLISWGANRSLWPIWNRFSHTDHVRIFVTTGGFLALALWLFPPLQPDFLSPHHLIISALGDRFSQSSGTEVIVQKIVYLDGSPIASQNLTTTSDWVELDAGHRSTGASDSALELRAAIPYGLRLFLRYSPQAGRLRLTWDGREENLDLYAPGPATLPYTLRGKGLFDLTLPQASLATMIALLYTLGIGFLILIGVILVWRVFGRRSPVMIQSAALLLIGLLFIIFKGLYLNADDPHIMRDSLSYVVTAEFSLLSPKFWLGQRPFTIPLALKLLGLRLDDYFHIAQLDRWAFFQTALSAFSWLILAFTTAFTTHRRWLRVLLFTLVLSFSLSVEVSLWDALLLSESLSFSFLALMLAGWLGLVVYAPTYKARWPSWLLLGITLLVTTLYIFGRDSNSYYAAAAALILLSGVYIDRRLNNLRPMIMVYTAAIFVLFGLQHVSLSNGNRWQVFMYDHLAMRILRDPQATAFFAARGLPLSSKLMETTTMRGSEYQPLIAETPELQPVKDWIQCCSIHTYIAYLAANPAEIITQPFENWPALLSGNLLGYRNPHNAVTPLPEKLGRIGRLYFWRSPGLTALLTVLLLAGIGFNLRRGPPAWLPVAALALTVPFMMVFIWWAEPMEIERHAAQIVIQFRLSGFLAILFLVETFFSLIQPKASTNLTAPGIARVDNR